MNAFLVLCTIIAQVAANDAPLVSLTAAFDKQPPNEMMKRYLTDKALAALEERKARYETLKTPEEIKAYQADLHAFFMEQLGGFPDRTPLNPQIVGQGETEWFRYEKVIFESRPKF